MNPLAQFLTDLIKVFALNRVVRTLRDSRPYAKIPTGSLFLSLLLGTVIRAGSCRDIAKQTKRRRWQHLIHWSARISEDAFCYVSERFCLEDLRQSLVGVNQQLKANKAPVSQRRRGWSRHLTNPPAGGTMRPWFGCLLLQSPGPWKTVRDFQDDLPSLDATSLTLL